MISTGTITRELVPKTAHDANAILDLAKQIFIHSERGYRDFHYSFVMAQEFYEQREKKFNELTGTK